MQLGLKIAITDLDLRAGLHCKDVAALTNVLSWGLLWTQFFFATVV